MFANNTLSDLLSADDEPGAYMTQFAQVGPTTAADGSVYDAAPAGLIKLSADPVFTMAPDLRGMSFTAPAADPLPATVSVAGVTVPNTAAAVQAQLDATQPTGGLAGVVNTIRNQVQYGIPGLFTSAKAKVKAALGGSATTASASTVKLASSPSTTSSTPWGLIALLAALVAGGFYLAKGKGKGGKSFFPKLGGGSSVKLH